MRGQPLRIRVAEDGSIEIVDPGPDEIALLREINPGLVLAHTDLPGFRGSPRLIATRRQSLSISRTDLPGVTTEELWRLHDEARRPSVIVVSGRGEASLLDAKIELARRLLQNCSLCARNCGIDRTRGERGACGLGPDAVVADAYLHVGEEAEIAPAFTLALAGCALRCRFCQQYPLLAPERIAGNPLDRRFWDDPDLAEARSLSFNGGNPDENLHAILRFLADPPETFRLPLVWKTHSYVLPHSLRLLDGVVDCFLPDLKWGSERCGRKLSRVADYPQLAVAAIAEMARQGVPVIVRLLVIPGHVECCHLPSIEALARIAASAKGPIILSIRDQYAPDYLIQAGDGDLCDRPNPHEIARVVEHARRQGLRQTGDVQERAD